MGVASDELTTVSDPLKIPLSEKNLGKTRHAQLATRNPMLIMTAHIISCLSKTGEFQDSHCVKPVKKPRIAGGEISLW